MSTDIVIKNGKIFTDEGQYPEGVAIGVKEGKIVAVTLEKYCPKGDRVIDAKGNYIFPGFVDPHVHMASPTYLPLETNTVHESQAFAAGGVTTILNGVFASSGFLEGCQKYVALYEQYGYVDLGLTAGLFGTEGVAAIRDLADYGVAGMKLLMPYKGVEMIPGFGEDMNDGIIYLTFREIARLVKEGYNIHCRVHCENIEVFFAIKDEYIKEGRTPRSYNEVRPGFLEIESMHRAIFFAELTSCPLYIVHNSLKEGVEIIAKARGRGVDVTGETCPQYLVLNEDNVDIIKSKVNPPLRTAEDNAALWKGIRDGVITCIGTDHAPCIRGGCPSLKLQPDKPPVWDVRWMGISGAEWFMPIMLSEGVNKKRICVEKMVEVCATNPAKKYGLFPKKGTIAVGSDADLVIADLNKEVTVPERPVFSYTDYCAYAGLTFKGWPILTMVRGTVVFEDGKIVGKAGYGKYCPAKVK